jgi:hypothetical protein
MWLWDALADDPAVDPKVRDDLAAGLTAFARALMKVAPEQDTDLCIRDADGRLTSFFDLNPRQISSDGTPLPPDSSLQNGFNAALAQRSPRGQRVGQLLDGPRRRLPRGVLASSLD